MIQYAEPTLTFSFSVRNLGVIMSDSILLSCEPLHLCSSEAQSCTPYVKEFDALSAAFNANQDMRAFLRGIRAEFRRLSTSEC